MGQGTESCGGYDSVYDEYTDGLIAGVWTQRNGVKIKLKEMSMRHLMAARLVAMRAIEMSNFSCDCEKLEDWVSVFDNEIAYRKSKSEINPIKIDKPTCNKRPLNVVRGVKVKMECHCGNIYFARKADIDRGWGFSCSKRCAAIRREFGKPKAKQVK